MIYVQSNMCVCTRYAKLHNLMHLYIRIVILLDVWIKLIGKLIK